MDRAVAMPAMRRLYEVSARIVAGRGVQQTLQAVVDGVVDGLGFGVAVVNYRNCDGSFETVAVAGSEEAREALLGTHSAADAFDAEFARAEEWGRLRFVPHERFPTEELTGWIPDVPVLDVPDAWHPLDALFAPLTSSRGDLVGMLSVDVPDDGRRPGPQRRELLELFAMQAGIAIDNARLTDDLRAEREHLVQEQARLHASETAFRMAFEGSVNGMAIVGLDPTDPGRFLRVNDAVCRIIGYSRERLLESRVEDFIHGEDAAASRRAVAEAMAGVRTRYRAERRFLRPGGATVWLSITAGVVTPGAGQPPFLLLHAEDITDRKVAESRLRHSADHDPLTGLANRRLLLRRLVAAQERARRTHRRGAVLFCDLDGFKVVNDRYGHAVGDRVLHEIGQRLLTEVRTRDTVARLGGDEFVIVAEDIDPDALDALHERIRRSVARPLAGLGVGLTVSIGDADLGGDAPAAADLLARADSAMYRAKTTARADVAGDG